MWTDARDRARWRSQGRSTTTTPATTTTTNAVFGSGFKSSGFGAAALAAGGFDPSKFATSKVTAADGKHDDENDGENDGDEDVEKECDAEFKPVVKLEIIEGAEATTTGEENEDILFEAYVLSDRASAKREFEREAIAFGSRASAARARERERERERERLTTTRRRGFCDF